MAGRTQRNFAKTYGYRAWYQFRKLGRMRSDAVAHEAPLST